MKKAILQARNVSKAFVQDGIATPVLSGIDAAVYQGDLTVIMGPSGAGKSTLLYALSAMDAITGGEIFYKGEAISAFSQKRLARLRAREFGFVFQQAHLVSNLTLFENVAVAGYLGGVQPPKAVVQRARALLTQMQVGQAQDRLPAQVSGGEAQRAAIARAMMNQPGLIFADEPTGALNRQNSEQVLNLLTGLNRGGQSILMVTHDLGCALRANRILYLEDGRILDELSLSPYGEGDVRAREARVSGWLAGLRW